MLNELYTFAEPVQVVPFSSLKWGKFTLLHTRQAKFEQITDLWSKYMTYGADYFKRIYDDVDRMRLLSGNDREILRKAYLSIAKGNLTDRQVKQISQVLDKLERETDYIMFKQ